MKINKKAQVGTTLTWFVAFLIVFFVMILFLAATLLISTRKKIDVGVSEYNSEKFESQRVLMNILQNKIIFNGEELMIKELVESWGNDKTDNKKEKIKEEIGKIVGEFKDEDSCYVFYAVLGSIEDFKKNIEETSKKDPRAGMYSSEVIEKGTIEVTNLQSFTDPRVSWGPEKQKEDMLSNAPEIKIPLENDNIKIKFFAGGTLKCKR